MKALGILGTSSHAGKTWLTTALCAWLCREGVRVAPFKAQNMSNNAWALPDGTEIARAQAVQAEACGLAPTVAMNPILLKPTGAQGSQLILHGRAVGHQAGRDYYREFDRLWAEVRCVLDCWRERCDVLVLEGAGSPVELNLMERDLVNLRPLRHLDGRWLLVGDIDRGGIYAQLAGTWALLPTEDRARGLGAVVNRFRGDLGLFPDPNAWLAPHAAGLSILGTVPFRPDLQPEEEDGFSRADEQRGDPHGAVIAWLRLPHAANLTDCQPWWGDTGVCTAWTADAARISRARAIVIPGSKNTLADLRWLRATGLDEAIIAAARRGVPVVGLCGGYQILGEFLSDPNGAAGDAGEERGLGLLPVRTRFEPEKIVRPVICECDGRRWTTYEIHMGRTESTASVRPLHHVGDDPDLTAPRPEGAQVGNVWGTYQHGWFEAPETRRRLARAAGIGEHRAPEVTWAEQRRAVYDAMADHVVEHVDLDSVRRYLGI
jgi:adenosylcobyric acid synthase